MKLARLQLHNFRVHRDTELHLSDGITAIVGPNGAGKSSLTEAVEWAFYGARGVRGTNDQIKNRRAKRGEDVRVEVDVVTPEGIVTVARTTGGGTVTKGSRVLANGSRETTAYVQDTLVGMTHEEFTASYLARQGELEWLAGEGPASRERFLASLLGHARLEDAQTEVRAQAREDQRVLDSIRAKLADVEGDVDIDALESTRDDLRSKAEAMAAEIEALEKKADALSDEATRLTKLLKQDRETGAKISSLKGDLRSVDEKVVELRETVEKIDEVVDTRPQREADLAELEKKVEEAEKRREEATREAREWRDRKAKAQSKLGEVTKLLGHLKELGPDAECDVCSQPLGGTYEDRTRHLEEDAARLKADVDEAHAKVAAADAVLNDLKWTRDAQRTIDRTTDALAKIREQAEKLPERKAQLKILKARSQDLSTEIAELEREKAGIGFSDEKLSAAQEGEREIRRTVTGKREKLRAVQKDVREAEAAVDRAQAAVDRKAKFKDEMDRLEKRVVIQKSVDDVFGQLRALLNDEMRPELSRIATEMIVDVAGGHFTELVLAEDYRPRLYMGDEEEPVPSGGELDMAALCIRLAVGQMIARRSGTPLDCVLLDEVFGSLYEDSQRAVMEVLQKLAGTRFRQIILVTHTLSARDCADHVFEIERTGLESDVRRIA